MHFYRTIRSHGLASLPPSHVDVAAKSYHTVLRLDGRSVAVAMREKDGAIHIDAGEKLTVQEQQAVREATSRMFRLDDDLAAFYAMIADDPMIGWASSGAGRLLASPSVFEDVVKTICTTNCAWSATVRMTSALVQLGRGAFPDASQLARTPDAWFRDVAKMGYRGPYIRAIAQRIVDRELDLEAFLPRHGMADDDVEAALLALPGIGPYAAAHVMQLLGRHRRLILDSWTRPKFLRLTKKKQAKDSTIVRTFARYGAYAGLAFWIFLTHDWE